MKVCFQCGGEKVLTDFYPAKGTKDGRNGKCKLCMNRDTRAYREANKERWVAFDKVRDKTEERLLAHKEYAVKTRENSPEKVSARTAVGNALRSGLLKRSPCEKCGVEKVEAHHDDYSKPLEVRWLCVSHHREWHKGQG